MNTARPPVRTRSAGWRGMLPHGGSALLLAVLIVVAWVMALLWSGPHEAVDAWRLLQEAKALDATAAWQASVHLALPVGAGVVTVVCMAALLTMERWWSPAAGTVPSAKELWPPPGRAGRLFGRWGVLVAIACALLLRLAPALSDFSAAERWNIRMATVGEWRVPGDGQDGGKFYPTGWDRALWYYEGPGNHPVQTVPARAAHETWRVLTGAEPGAISEWVIRLPVLLAGLAAIWLTAWLARCWSGRAAAVAVAWGMALHPWLLRDGVEARSYGMTIFLIAVTLFALWRAVSLAGGGRIRWWWLFALGQCLLMWAHPLAHSAVCLALFAAGLLLIRKHNTGGARRSLTLRLITVNAVAAAVFCLLFLPCLLQVNRWLDSQPSDGLAAESDSLAQALWQLAFGQDAPPSAGALAPAWAGWLVIAAGLAAGWCGGKVLRKRSADAALITLAAVAGYVVFFAAVKLTGFYFHDRFLVGMVPVALLPVAIGMSKWPRLFALPAAGWLAIIVPVLHALIRN